MAQKYFNDLEAIEIAINIEKSGERFYNAAATKTQNRDFSEMFTELAQQEKEHAETFEALYAQIKGSKESFDDSYIFDPDVSAYLYAMVQTTIFPSQERQDEILEDIRSVKNILELGIQAEKESILFYTEMIIYSKFVEAKEVFRKLLNEEKKHLIDLQKRLKQLV